MIDSDVWIDGTIVADDATEAFGGTKLLCDSDAGEVCASVCGLLKVVAGNMKKFQLFKQNMIVEIINKSATCQTLPIYEEGRNSSQFYLLQHDSGSNCHQLQVYWYVCIHLF